MVTLRTEVDLLRRIPLFAKIEPAKLKLLAFASERLQFENGQDLFRQGDMADAAYVIIDGTADVLADTPAGEIPIASLKRNDIVGEIGILCDVPRTATVRSRGPVELYSLGRGDFQELLGRFEEVRAAMTGTSDARYLETQNRLLTRR